MLGVARHLLIAASGISAFTAVLPPMAVRPDASSPVMQDGVEGRPAVASNGGVEGGPRRMRDDMGDCLARPDAVRAMYAAMCSDIAAAAGSIDNSGDIAVRMMDVATVPQPRAKPSRPPTAVEHRTRRTNLSSRSDVITPCKLDEKASSPSAAGMLFPVRRGCRLASPRKGTVVFAGFFRGYRGLVILDVGHRRHLVIGGLGEIVVKLHQLVDRGTPLGLSALQGRATLPGESDGSSTPILVGYREAGRAWAARSSRMQAVAGD